MAAKKGRKNPISISHMCASATKEMANSKAAALDSHGMEEDGTAQPWVVNSFSPPFHFFPAKLEPEIFVQVVIIVVVVIFHFFSLVLCAAFS